MSKPSGLPVSHSRWHQIRPCKRGSDCSAFPASPSGRKVRLANRKAMTCSGAKQRTSIVPNHVTDLVDTQISRWYFGPIGFRSRFSSGYAMRPTDVRFGTKQTSACALHMSAFWGRRTCLFALHMSAYDPKSTSLFFRSAWRTHDRRLSRRHVFV